MQQSGGDGEAFFLPAEASTVCRRRASLCLLLRQYDSDFLALFDRANMMSRAGSIRDAAIFAFGRSGFVISVTHQRHTSLSHDDIKKENRKRKRNQYQDAVYDTALLSALKVSVMGIKQNPDNLFYEAFVGREVINGFCDRFPLFVRTYHLYHILSQRDVWFLNQLAKKYLESVGGKKRRRMFAEENLDEFFDLGRPGEQDEADRALEAVLPTTTGEFDPEILQKMFGSSEKVAMVSTSLSSLRSFQLACRDSRQLVLQTEFVDKSEPLSRFLDAEFHPATGENNDFFWNFECANLLMQIYAPLAAVCDQFTHYDLHLRNLMVASLPARKHVVFKYSFEGRTVFVASKFVVKLVDYGRCFTPLTESFRAHLCKADRGKGSGGDEGKDEHGCGIDHGFRYLNYTPEEARESRTFLLPRQRNKSHDLRAAYLLRHHLLEKEPEFRARKFDRPDFPGHAMRNILRNVYFQHHYGTPEAASDPEFRPEASFVRPTNTRIIRNVTDLFRAVFEYCSQPAFAQHRMIYEELSKNIGDLNIQVA